MAWVHTDNPNLKRIKIEGMNDDLWFTTNQYAETSSQVADLLAGSSSVSGISKVSEPSNPGEYYGSDVDGTTIEVSLQSDTFENVTATNSIEIGYLRIK